MFRIDGNTIIMTRGDTVRVKFALKMDGVPYELQEGDVVRFAVNTPVNHKNHDGLRIDA